MPPKSNGNVPKKHHFVPQFLLEYFASADRRLIVHRLKSTSSYAAAVMDVGHRNLGHTIYMPGRDPDHESLEKGMSQIEGAAATVIRDLLTAKNRQPSPEQQEVLAWLIALQWQRHRLLLDLLRAKLLRDNPVGPDSPEYEYATKSLGLHAIFTGIILPWQSREDPTASLKERWNPIVSRLSEMSWRLLRPRRPALVVSDNLVCLSGLAAGYAPELPPAYYKHGIGLGFESFQRLTMPLAPTLGLVISRDKDDAAKVTSRKMNSLTVWNSREFVAHSPDFASSEPGMHEALLSELNLQRWVAKYIYPGLKI
jgi:hypothetical protein